MSSILQLLEPQLVDITDLVVFQSVTSRLQGCFCLMAITRQVPGVFVCATMGPGQSLRCVKSMSEWNAVEPLPSALNGLRHWLRLYVSSSYSPLSLIVRG